MFAARHHSCASPVVRGQSISGLRGDVISLTFGADHKTLYAGMSRKYWVAVEGGKSDLSTPVQEINLTTTGPSRFVRGGIPTALAYHSGQGQLLYGNGEWEGPRAGGSINHRYPFRFYGQAGIRSIAGARLSEVSSTLVPGSVVALTSFEDTNLIAALIVLDQSTMELQLLRADDLELVQSVKFSGTPCPPQWLYATRPMVALPGNTSILISTVGNASAWPTGRPERPIPSGGTSPAAIENRGEGKLVELNLESMEIVRELRFPKGPITFIDVSPNGAEIAFVSNGFAYSSEWPTDDITDARELPESPTVAAVFFGRTGSNLIRLHGVRSGVESFVYGDVISWQGTSYELLAKLVADTGVDFIFSATQSPDRTCVATGGSGGAVCVWDLSGQ